MTRAAVRCAMARAAPLVLVFAAPSLLAGRPLEGVEPEPVHSLAAWIVLDGARVVAEHEADRLLEPASTLKLVTAAAALDMLGPQYRAETRASAPAAPDEQGVVAGDLVIHGAGDPTWNSRFFPQAAARPLARLAAALRARGVRRVAGDLVLDEGRFPPPAQPRSRPLAEMVLGWAAPVSALAVDENAVLLRIAPGSRVTQPVHAAVARRVFGAPELVVRAYTVGAERHGHGTVSFLPLVDRAALMIDGEYPLSEPSYELAVAMPDPARAVAASLRAALADAGIAVDGVDRTARVPRVPGVVLATLHSPPLARWLVPMLEESHNWYAEMVLRQVALARTGSGRLEDGLAVVMTWLSDTVGVPASDFALDDGSGLSAENLITARALATLLAWATGRPWHAALVQALARPGRGTLQGWPALPRMAAKTGSKHHVQGLAGYLRPASKHPRVFVILLDHRTDTPAARRAEIARLLAPFVRQSEHGATNVGQASPGSTLPVGEPCSDPHRSSVRHRRFFARGARAGCDRDAALRDAHRARLRTRRMDPRDRAMLPGICCLPVG